MHHRIPKLLGTHVHPNEVTCAYKTQAITSKVNVTLRGQRSKWVLFGRTVPCPAHILTIYHSFPRNLAQTFTMMRRRVVLKTHACNPNLRLHLEVKGQISTMHHGIPKLLGTHVHHDEVACRAQDQSMYFKGQGHTKRSKVEMRNYSSYNS